MIIDVTQEDRQYWKVIVESHTEEGVVSEHVEITIQPEGMSCELVQGGEFVGVAQWGTWAELIDTLKGES